MDSDPARWTMAMNDAYAARRQKRARLLDDLLAAWSRLEAAERWAARSGLPAALKAHVVDAARGGVTAAERAVEVELT